MNTFTTYNHQLGSKDITIWGITDYVSHPYEIEAISYEKDYKLFI